MRPRAAIAKPVEDEPPGEDRYRPREEREVDDQVLGVGERDHAGPPVAARPLGANRRSRGGRDGPSAPTRRSPTPRATSQPVAMATSSRYAGSSTHSGPPSYSRWRTCLSRTNVR